MENTAIAAKRQPEAKQHHASQKARTIAGTTIIYILLAIMGIVWILPIVWVVLQSFTGQASQSAGRLFPTLWDFQVVEGAVVGNRDPFTYTLGWFGNYRLLFMNKVAKDGIIQDSIYNFFAYVADGKLYFGGFMNTLLISVLVAIISTLLVLSTSYAFSRLRFKGRTMMMRLIMILGMFPGFLGLIILYNMFALLNEAGFSVFYRSIWALILVYSGGAGMGYYISKGFFDTISKQIDEAAMVDGATRFQIFYKITMPLSKPIIVYTVLTSFMSPWAEYITASYLLGGQTPEKDNWTVPLILYQMINNSELTNRPPYWGQFCAGAVIVAIPTSILFIFMQKYYVSGVTGGAVKG